MALKRFLMGTVEPLSTDTHRQEGGRKLAAWAQWPFWGPQVHSGTACEHCQPRRTSCCLSALCLPFQTQEGPGRLLVEFVVAAAAVCCVLLSMHHQ